MSALPAATVEMINGLSDRNTRRLVSFIEELRKEEMSPLAIEMFPEKSVIDDEKFFSGANMEHLKRSLAEAKKADIATSKKAFERLMRYKGILPADFDYRAELAATWAERLKGLDLFTDDFLADGIEDAPAQVREFL